MFRGAKYAVAALAALAVGTMAATAVSAKNDNNNGSGGITPGAAFYVDGEEYRTVATPSDLSNTGAPAHSFDIIYAIMDEDGNSFDGQINVAEAAPGDTDYNGGRWMVHAIVFSDYDGAVSDEDVDLNGNGVLDSDAEVLAAIEEGYAFDDGVIAKFVCPAIPLH